MFDKVKKQSSLDKLYLPVERPLLDAKSLQKHLTGGNTNRDSFTGSISREDFSAAASVAKKKLTGEANTTYQTLILTHEKLQYKVLEPYTSEAGEGTLALDEGSVVIVEEKGDEGWWFATASDPANPVPRPPPYPVAPATLESHDTHPNPLNPNADRTSTRGGGWEGRGGGGATAERMITRKTCKNSMQTTRQHLPKSRVRAIHRQT